MMDLALKDLVFAVLVSTTQTVVFEVSYQCPALVTYGCGTSSSENCTYFTNSNPVAGPCSHKVIDFKN